MNELKPTLPLYHRLKQIIDKQYLLLKFTKFDVHTENITVEVICQEKGRIYPGQILPSCRCKHCCYEAASQPQQKAPEPFQLCRCCLEHKGPAQRHADLYGAGHCLELSSRTRIDFERQVLDIRERTAHPQLQHACIEEKNSSNDLHLPGVKKYYSVLQTLHGLLNAPKEELSVETRYMPSVSV